MDVLATRAVVEQRMRSWGSTAETLGAAEYASKVEVLVQCTLALDMPCAPTSLPLSICGAPPDYNSFELSHTLARTRTHIHTHLPATVRLHTPCHAPL